MVVFHLVYALYAHFLCEGRKEDASFGEQPRLDLFCFFFPFFFCMFLFSFCSLTDRRLGGNLAALYRCPCCRVRSNHAPLGSYTKPFTASLPFCFGCFVCFVLSGGHWGRWPRKMCTCFERYVLASRYPTTPTKASPLVWVANAWSLSALLSVCTFFVSQKAGMKLMASSAPSSLDLKNFGRGARFRERYEK